VNFFWSGPFGVWSTKRYFRLRSEKYSQIAPFPFPAPLHAGPPPPRLALAPSTERE
jgi:hypothetical protein